MKEVLYFRMKRRTLTLKTSDHEAHDEATKSLYSDINRGFHFDADAANTLRVGLFSYCEQSFYIKPRP